MADFSKPQSIMTMLVTIFALLYVSLAFQHGAHHHHARSNDAIEARSEKIAGELEKRQSGEYIALVGACSSGYDDNGQCNPGSESHPRLEIRDLQNKPEQWNLYMLGLERLMSKDNSDELGYERLAALHGKPFIPWNQYVHRHPASFCPHSQMLFATWHGAFLSMFEQALYQTIQEVVAEFPESEQGRLREAARTFRLPYWQFTLEVDGTTVPSSIRKPTIRVIKPSGNVTIHNPLFSFKWAKGPPADLGGPSNNFPETLRHPFGNPPRSNIDEMAAQIDAMSHNLRDRLFAIFATKQPFGDVTSTARGVRTKMKNIDSIESVHDALHNAIGGPGGHMYNTDLSAYDPAFYLLHSAVEYMVCLLKVTVGNTYSTFNGTITRDMGQYDKGQHVDATTGLLPFTKDHAGHNVNSLDFQDTRRFGYHYVDSSGPYEDVIRVINRLYGGGKSMSKRTDESNGKYHGRPFRDGDFHYVLSITANKLALNGSYLVHCFIGKRDNSTSTCPNTNSNPPYPTSTLSPYPNTNSTSSKDTNSKAEDDPSQDTNSKAEYDPSKDYTQDANYIGSYGILGTMKAGGGDSSSLPLMSEGSLPLTTTLMGKQHYGEIASLKPEDVEPYLVEHLYYKVVGEKGELNPEDIPGFHVKVTCTKVTPAASDDELPDLSAPYQILHEATVQLPAGKPVTYVPTAMDNPLPEDPAFGKPGSDGTMPTSPAAGVSYPSLPWQEQGSCMPKRIVHYVDPSGKFLYAET